MSAPRSAPRLLVGTFELYRRYPALFLVLAAGVIVPYELITLAATGTGPLSRSDTSAGVQLFLFLADWALVTPLVSALHVRAVSEVRDDREPRLGPVALGGLKALPVVAAATIASLIGTSVGFVLLIIPGLFLLLHWAVVAQAAAIEREGWLPALRRSGKLADGHYIHIAILLVMVGVIETVPFFLGGLAFRHHETGVASFLTALALRVLTASFAALAGALLYYDLVARGETEPQLTAAGPPQGSFDPRSYSDFDRPKGWYVDPASPTSMRHWGGSDRPEWNSRTRTPRKIRRSWHKESSEEAPHE
ncbi:MAG TPA: hypothetical protein VN752_13055 [Solirubrobacterales bacterium]|nr:hypothetical protein [Solirubrobacterales bacterium]